MVLLLVFMQLTRDLFAIAKFLLGFNTESLKNSLEHDYTKCTDITQINYRRSNFFDITEVKLGGTPGRR